MAETFCCTTFEGIPRDCESSVGGIRRAWAGCVSDVGEPTIATNMITDVGNESAWKPFEFRKQTGNFVTTLNRDDANGTLFYSTDVVLQFLRLSTTSRLEVMALAQSDTGWIVEDNNGSFWYFGLFEPVTLSEGTAETGTAFEDFNGYNITLNDLSNVLPYEVSEEAMADLLNPPA